MFPARGTLRASQQILRAPSYGPKRKQNLLQVPIQSFCNSFCGGRRAKSWVTKFAERPGSMTWCLFPYLVRPARGDESSTNQHLRAAGFQRIRSRRSRTVVGSSPRSGCGHSIRMVGVDFCAGKSTYALASAILAARLLLGMGSSAVLHGDE